MEFLLAEIEALELKLSSSLPTRDGLYKNLSRIESELFDKLLSAKGRVVSKEALYAYIYQLRPEEKQPELKIIDIFICKLRKKLKESKGPEIFTSWGRGYWIEAVASIP